MMRGSDEFFIPSPELSVDRRETRRLGLEACDVPLTDDAPLLEPSPADAPANEAAVDVLTDEVHECPVSRALHVDVVELALF